MRAPLFLSVEGLDGSGGTTQLGRLAAWLGAAHGLAVHTTREPSAGPIGRFIRSALGDPAEAVSDAALAWLFAADRRDHLDREILPALAAGRTVLSDRYVHSSLAYQSLALGLERVAELNADFRAPDLVLFLDLDPRACLARIQARGEVAERFERLDRLERIAGAWHLVLDRAERRGERIARIDASGTPDAVEARVRAAVAPLLGS